MQTELVPASTAGSGWRRPTIKPVARAEESRSVRHLMTLAHISDTHICDAQSPARLPFTNRFGDPHHPFAPLAGTPVGNYRPNEFLTAQVLDSMIQAVNRARGTIAGQPVSLTVITGDISDNAQENEFDWAKRLLIGGTVTPNSGGSEFQGPGGKIFDPYYWNPEERNEPDFPKKLFGFPTIPELLSAATSSFSATGLNMPFIAVHGNHDELLQGTVPQSNELREFVVGAARPVQLKDFKSLQKLADEFTPVGPVQWPGNELVTLAPVDSDSTRKFVDVSSWTQTFGTQKYSAEVHGGILFVSLNTVNPHGGWEGSIDVEQLSWLEQILVENDSSPIVLLSHHPLSALKNDYAPVGAPRRVNASEFESFLSEHSNIVAWLAGHEHRNSITRVGGENGFWHIETCSLIDWPQEARLIEFLVDGDELVLAMTMLQHQSSVSVLEGGELSSEHSIADPSTLAALSREISINDWQRQTGDAAIEQLQGSEIARNVSVRKKIAGLRL